MRMITAQDVRNILVAVATAGLALVGWWDEPEPDWATPEPVRTDEDDQIEETT